MGVPPSHKMPPVHNDATTLSTYLSLIQQYLSVFMFDNAIWLAERCVAEHPTDSEAVYLLALSHYRSGAAKAARVVLERTNSITTPTMQFLAAQCAFEIKDYIRAETLLLKSCRATYEQIKLSLDRNGNMDDWIVETSVRQFVEPMGSCLSID
jgi:DNA-binding SARP family transcriptional activator